MTVAALSAPSITLITSSGSTWRVMYQPMRRLLKDAPKLLRSASRIASEGVSGKKIQVQSRSFWTRMPLASSRMAGALVALPLARQLVTAASISFTSRITARCPSVEELAQASRPTPVATT